jgi:hypothetical protein
MGRDGRQEQLAYLFAKQDGLCHICGEPAVLDYEGGKAGHPLSAVRFRLGSSYGTPGRRRRRVMAHRKCAQERSDAIQDSIPVEERRARSLAWPTEFYALKEG